MHLDDLLLRRTELGEDPRTARRLAPRLSEWFGPDPRRRAEEVERLERALERAREPLA